MQRKPHCWSCTYEGTFYLVRTTKGYLSCLGALVPDRGSARLFATFGIALSEAYELSPCEILRLSPEQDPVIIWNSHDQRTYGKLAFVPLVTRAEPV